MTLPSAPGRLEVIPTLLAFPTEDKEDTGGERGGNEEDNESSQKQLFMKKLGLGKRDNVRKMKVAEAWDLGK